MSHIFPFFFIIILLSFYLLKVKTPFHIGCVKISLLLKTNVFPFSHSVTGWWIRDVGVEIHKVIGLHILITQCNYHFRCISITITINYHYHTIYPFSSANNKVGEREIDTRLHLLQFSMSTSCVLIHSFHFVVFFSSVSLQWKGTVPLPTHSQLLRERE